jgi:putative membrane protein
MYLTDDEATAIGKHVGGIEARTGTEVVVAIVGRADRYPEIRWKAFALGVAFAAFALVLFDALRSAWSAGPSVLPTLVAVLAAGVTNALCAMYLPRYGRLFVRDNRAEAEVRQYAESMFLARGLHGTARRQAVLIVVGLFERWVVVHADQGCADRIAPREWEAVIAPVALGLRAGDVADAVQAGLSALETLLATKGFVGHGDRLNVAPDRPLEERGA